MGRVLVQLFLACDDNEHLQERLRFSVCYTAVHYYTSIYIHPRSVLIISYYSGIRCIRTRGFQSSCPSRLLTVMHSDGIIIIPPYSTVSGGPFTHRQSGSEKNTFDHSSGVGDK